VLISVSTPTFRYTIGLDTLLPKPARIVQFRAFLKLTSGSPIASEGSRHLVLSSGLLELGTVLRNLSPLSLQYHSLLLPPGFRSSMSLCRLWVVPINGENWQIVLVHRLTEPRFFFFWRFIAKKRYNSFLRR
jgi:hypothetical protein